MSFISAFWSSHLSVPVGISVFGFRAACHRIGRRYRRKSVLSPPELFLKSSLLGWNPPSRCSGSRHVGATSWQPVCSAIAAARTVINIDTQQVRSERTRSSRAANMNAVSEACRDPACGRSPLERLGAVLHQI